MMVMLLLVVVVVMMMMMMMMMMKMTEIHTHESRCIQCHLATQVGHDQYVLVRDLKLIMRTQ